MKTVLFHVNYFLAGGIEKVLIELLRAIDPNRYRIRLSIGYHMGDKEILKKELPEYVEVHYLLEHPVLVYTQKKKKTAQISLPEKLLGELIFPPIRKAVQRKVLQRLMDDTDVIVDFDSTLSRFHNVFAGKRSAVYSHFTFRGENRRELDKIARRLNYYDRVVMLCDEMKAEAIAYYPFLEPKLVRIYNAMDQDRILRMAKEPIDGHQIGENGYIVSVGRLQEAQKDFRTLIKAYIDCVRRYGIKEHLVIVGYGDAQEKLERLVAEAGMTERIHFTGFQKNPYKWISRSKLFLFSSKYEGLPTVIIEALLLGRPVIATACPTGVRELLMEGQAGILTPVGDVTAMSDALATLLGDSALRDLQVANAAKMLGYFDPAFMMGEVERLLLN